VQGRAHVAAVAVRPSAAEAALVCAARGAEPVVAGRDGEAAAGDGHIAVRVHAGEHVHAAVRDGHIIAPGELYRDDLKGENA